MKIRIALRYLIFLTTNLMLYAYHRRRIILLHPTSCDGWDLSAEKVNNKHIVYTRRHLNQARPLVSPIL